MNSSHSTTISIPIRRGFLIQIRIYKNISPRQLLVLKMYTRVYTEISPRKLVSGKGPRDAALSQRELLNEFLNHSDRKSQQPTRLVSVSSRIVDTVKRACDIHYRDNEPAASICIVFISVPGPPDLGENEIIVHHAEMVAGSLAEYFEDVTPELFRYEYLFEGFIPESLVVHRISLATLLDRASKENTDFHSIFERRYMSTDVLRTRIAAIIQHIADQSGFWDVGIWLAFFASLFGARAQIKRWIAYQLFFDCVKCTHIDEDVFRLEYHRNSAGPYVDSSDLQQIDKKIKDGIDTVLIDWWFTTDKFIANWELYKNKRSAMEDHISWRTDEFIEKLGKEGPLGMQKADYDRERAELCFKNNRQRAALEQDAISMGL